MIGVFINEEVTTIEADVLTRLRAETRAEHDAIEQALDLMDADLTVAQYRRRLQQFHGFYRPLETRLQAMDHWLSPWLNVRPRLKTPLLEQDLLRLGENNPRSLPVCNDLPMLEDAAGCFGCLYVLEGSTLGGQLIGRHIREQLGITPAAGGLFFNSYGDRTGAMWREFRLALTQFSSAQFSLNKSLPTGDPAQAQAQMQDRIVQSARATFEALRLWCQQESLR